MTLITLQDGKIVLRDGKVGTEQACCCGSGGDPCVPGCVCETYGCSSGGLSCGEGEARGNEWLASIYQWVADQGLVAALEANGYTSISEQGDVSNLPGGTCTDENGNTIPYDPAIHQPCILGNVQCDCCDVWTTFYGIYFNCCGEIDYEAEPIWQSPDPPTADQPISGGGEPCLDLIAIYPCIPNPLP